jgi:general secretion pathway protein E
MDINDAKRIGDYLIEKGSLNPDALNAAIEEHRITEERIGNILVRNGFISQDELVEAIKDVDMDQLSSEQTLVTACPSTVLIQYRTMILAETKETIHVATFNDEEVVRQVLRNYYPREEILFHGVDITLLDEYLERIERLNEDDDVVLDRIIRQALRLGVTDIHIYPPRTGSYSIFNRYLGVLRHTHEGDMEEYQRMIAQIKDRSSMDLAERRVPQDGAFQVEYNGNLVDMRVATLPSNSGEKVVIRLLDPNRIDPKLDSLGITRLRKWRAGVSEAQGLCLICGPTGSGKTTTLSSTVREIDRFGKSINTLEDPVEYRIPYIMQMNINHAVGLDFARGLRAYMRADPDVIIVGEIRDSETAQYALKAAETGHLVIGTLHTGSIEGSLQRLHDLDVEQAELRYLLRSVLVQRLMRTFCPKCAGEGCGNCMQSGFAGRTVVSEVEYFEDEKQVDQITSAERWWPTMIEDAVTKVQSGQTGSAELIRVFGEPGRKALREAGYAVRAIDE